MKTIRIDMVDKEIPTPSENPVVLHAVEDSNMSFGDIRHIRTGIRFYVPADIEKVFHTRVPGLVILGHQQVEPSGDLILIVLCSIMSVRIGRMQPVAEMNLYEMKPVAVRFAMFGDGRRLMFGTGEKIENSIGISDTKP